MIFFFGILLGLAMAITPIMVAVVSNALAARSHSRRLDSKLEHQQKKDDKAKNAASREVT